MMAGAATRATPLQTLVFFLMVVSVFCGGLKVTYGFDWRLSYLVLATAIGLLFLAFPRPRLPLGVILVVGAYLTFCLAVVALRTPQLLIGHALPQAIGIGVFCTAFALFFATASPDPRIAFALYVKIGTVVALLGLPVLAYTGLADGFFRLRSVFAEPAHYATVMMPAFYYTASHARTRPRRFLIHLGAMLLTVSAVAYIGILLTMILLMRGSLGRKLLFGVVGTMFAVIAYLAAPPITERVDDTLRVAVTRDFTGANLSTFALMGNLFVAANVFAESPVVGGGLGTHAVNHERFLYAFSGVEHLGEVLNQNYNDASSLLVRIVSEQGLVGIVVTIVFFFSFARARYPCDQVFSTGIMIYLLLKLLRDGHYFTPEFYFFVMIYYLVGSKALSRTRRVLVADKVRLA